MVYLEELQCEGVEESLLDCPIGVELGLSLCDHSADAGVRCYGMDCGIYLSLSLPNTILSE